MVKAKVTTKKGRAGGGYCIVMRYDGIGGQGGIDSHVWYGGAKIGNGMHGGGSLANVCVPFKLGCMWGDVVEGGTDKCIRWESVREAGSILF